MLQVIAVRVFWDIVKPLISSKCGIKNDNIIIINGDDVYTKPREVASVFNTYFTNIAENIGINDSCSYDNVLSCLAIHKHHESVQNIKQFMESREITRGFTFYKVDTDMVKFFLNKLKPNKATGCDMLPSKLLKMASDILSNSICYLVNLSFTLCFFPNELKSAEITPLFKKGNYLDISSYRPVIVLPSLSNIFENIMVKQLSFYFDEIFSKFLSGFRRNHSCETVLIR